MKKIIIPLLAISFLILPNHSLKNVNISIGPYTQNVSNDSITIVWETDVATSINYVEYWNDEQKYVAYDNTTSIHHEITISPSFSSATIGYHLMVLKAKSIDLSLQDTAMKPENLDV